ncbi:MAG: TonB-dependent receptor, partial [Prevotellaceae bacterium]|nr:TonB-dependent receptor [Prevotellaceae bacterium]
MKKTTFLAARLSAVLALALFASIAHAQDAKSSQKEEKNRNVMLNAASANGPREIQIGLPSADVNVLENGLPVTYATNPHSVNANWRSDASLSHVGLL